MAALPGQQFEIELSGASIRYRQYTTGGTAQWNYYPVAHIKCIEPVQQIGFGTRDTTTNQRKNSTRQDDLLRITISFIDDTKPLIFDIQNVMNQAGWTPDAAGVTQALTDINGWIVTGGGGAGDATEATLLNIYNEQFDNNNGSLQGSFELITSFPYTVQADTYRSYSITTIGSVAADGETVPSGTIFEDSYPSSLGFVNSPLFTDVSGGSLYVTLSIK